MAIKMSLPGLLFPLIWYTNYFGGELEDYVLRFDVVHI